MTAAARFGERQKTYGETIAGLTLLAGRRDHRWAREPVGGFYGPWPNRQAVGLRFTECPVPSLRRCRSTRSLSPIIERNSASCLIQFLSGSALGPGVARFTRRYPHPSVAVDGRRQPSAPLSPAGRSLRSNENGPLVKRAASLLSASFTLHSSNFTLPSPLPAIFILLASRSRKLDRFHATDGFQSTGILPAVPTAFFALEGARSGILPKTVGGHRARQR